MNAFHINPQAQHPFYPKAMRLVEARPGTQFVTLDVRAGNVTLTTLSSQWRANVVPIVSGNGFHLASVIRLQADDVHDRVIDLWEVGLHPAVEATESWNGKHFSVLATRESILPFYPWLMKEGFGRAANEIEDQFFDYFVDNTTFWNQLVQSGA